MESSAIADRRQLRRKLSFWRIVAVLLLVGLGFALYRFAGGELGAGRKPQIARVAITGVIQDDKELLERLKTIEDDNQVKALIVSISSPGGTTYGGERIFKAIRAVATKKPVVSDIRTMAASAGYLVAAAGDTIVAGDTSITGSIGVLLQYPQVKDLLDKLGVSMEAIKSSPMKAEPSPFHPPSDEAKAMINNMVMDSYGWFVDLVADRRKLPRDQVLKLADGSIFTGRQALANKLVDSLGGDDDIRAYLETRKVAKDLPVVDWDAPRRTSPFFLPGAAADLITLLGYGDFIKGDGAQKLLSEKLFLDGLLSVWQGDAH
ncbi:MULTISPECIES: signal peptide peptidase SppA [unclassified Rhizobium]|uniref:signal peptide peptidase SppA n=1 Tax=unclassified Rhizobium TaxID=2613769 RepID=UPI001AD9C318|nr:MULTISPECIES: signal peptide peptidase SppA [unclassified Rhizobium]MBO9097078.1 signal peptide peptidase SppA [Rhizobium sp. L58/93]MBO9134070.1 signal peptide peptidase SppA [Rhizobium sp. B209b/85]MBO9167316.1 signal peptide peptidase SppA [Rhizobium sp. L245/93]MBO9183275.1 signal peptide peptidase SppA [Rhizobium sp. E27B/91]QXZ83618.1 signal peptide peptidase SppA [Rhizobium sp. K1/93]